MRKLPPLKALLMFETAANFTSFTEAANTLCVTHGAVSHQMRALEQWFGQALFERHKGGVRLTEAGAQLRVICRDAFSPLEGACGNLRRAPAAECVKVGCSGSFLGHWLIPGLERFELDHPEIALELRMTDVFADLVRRKVDVMITMDPPPNAPDIDIARLAHDEIGPVCAASWSALPPSAEKLQECLLHTASRPDAWQEWAVAAGVAIAPERGRKFDNLTLTLEAAKNGLGYAIAPELLIRRELGDGSLRAPLGFVKTGGSVYFCVRRGQETSASIRGLYDWLAQEV